MDSKRNTPLDSYMRQFGGRLGVREAKHLLLPLMDALAEVHDRGIVHRDIAPDNILITGDGTAKLIDFGAARYSTGEKSRSLDVILKHGFAPYEQYMRRGRQGPWTDVYAMGATFYYAVTGKVPPEAVERMQEDILIPPGTLGVKIDAATEDALLKALEVNASDRFQNMRDFCEAMDGGASSPAAPEKGKTQQDAPQEKAQHTAERVPAPASFSAVPPQGAEKAEKAAPAPALKPQSVTPAPKKSKLPLILGLAALLVGVLVFVITRPKLSDNRSPEVEGGGAQANAVAASAAAEAAKSDAYADALSLLDAGQYKEAAERFAALGDYQDAQTEASNALAFADALALLDAGKLWDASRSFAALGDYRDAQAQREIVLDSIRKSFRTSIAGGGHHTVGLKANGTAIATGYNLYGQCNVSDWTDLVAVSAGRYHTVGLRADGTAVAAGYNEDGQCDVGGWTDLVAVSAGWNHTVGLRADGTVVAVGSNRYSQCEVSGWTDLVAVSVGWDYTVGLRADGTAVAVGKKDLGKCNVIDWTDLAVSPPGG